MPIVTHKGDLETKIKVTILSTIFHFYLFFEIYLHLKKLQSPRFQILNIPNKTTLIKLPYRPLTVLFDYQQL